MDLEAGYQLLTTKGINTADFTEKFNCQSGLNQNEREPCFASILKSLFIQTGRHLAATASFLVFLIAGDTQNPTWLTPIIDLYRWKTFRELATLRLANWFEFLQISASYIPPASVSLTTIPAVCYLVPPTKNPEVPAILDKMSNTYPEFKTVMYVSNIVWIIFTGLSVIHYFWKTKVRTASIPGFGMKHFYLTLLKLVAIGVDLSIVNALIRTGSKWEWTLFPLIYFLLILMLTVHYSVWGGSLYDMRLMRYFGSKLKGDELAELYRAYKKEYEDDVYELPTIRETIRNSYGNNEAQPEDNASSENT